MMKCRSFISKSLLFVASIFWASCGEDDAQPVYGCNCVNDLVPESSESLESSASTPLEETSSVSPVSSSSTLADNHSSSSTQYRLASDTSVTCNSTTRMTECLGTICDYDPPIECHDEQLKLEFNQTEPLEKLDSIENRLEKCFEAIPLYGTGPCYCVGYRTTIEYTCSNGHVFPYAKDGLVYTKEEYEAKFPSSSSSEASSSSAVPSPLCQKTGFVNKNDVSDSCIKEKLDSLTATGETVSDSLKTCLQKSFDWSTGEYAKTQICDGDTTVNPRYQAKLDSIREEVDKAIKDCRAAEDSVDSTKVPADSTVTPIDTAATSQE